MRRDAVDLGDPLLEPARFHADPVADACIAQVLGPLPDGAFTAATSGVRQKQIGWVNQQFARWNTNAALAGWLPDANAPEAAVKAMRDYVAKASVLPDWTDHAKVLRAQEIFTDYSLLSCTLLFCASLPECYVIPDLAAVLHAAGQLEQHTEHRIRATAAMIFPVMMKGGLDTPEGSGVAQIIKVRLIHATIRNMVLRGQDPDLVGHHEARRAVAPIPPMQLATPASNLYEALMAMGWDVDAEGLPCNQEELAYTLLTFGYVFLRGMRTLGLRLPDEDERAYLHGWNVVGHVLGIRRELMADDMETAAALFARMQARGRARPVLPDSRPELAGALINTMRSSLDLHGILRNFPLLLTRHLCTRRSVRDLGLNKRCSIFSVLLFSAILGIVRGIDTVVRIFSPKFAITRFITRLVGYPLVTKLLLDQTRPLLLPERLLEPVQDMSKGWRFDPQAPRWLNVLERRMVHGKATPAAAAPL
ncbi:oxygenase MpaB family protein [Niveibacterium sp. SC-1]|uniref:oxygenase MpaB family protein n=1 Tax=Niveibacterium sp. SC-1 TaxID=3135646 RepID=UPI0031200977